MTGFAFTPQRVAQIRKQNGVVACLFPASESVMEGRLRYLYREFATHDGDNKVTGRKRERVQDVSTEGELTPARLTVLLVELVDVIVTDGQPLPGYRPLDMVAARACGFRTVIELREHWRGIHPQQDTAQLVWFAMGDVRDKDRFLQRWVWKGGDYSTNRHSAVDELPALSPAELEELAANSRQRSTARTADTASKLADETLAQRVARLERVAPQLLREIRNELDIIEQRTRRGHKKLQ